MAEESVAEESHERSPDPGRRTGRWLRLGVRARLTLAATALVAVGLAAGAMLLTVALQRSLLRSLDESAHQQAAGVATLARTGNLPATIPVAGGTSVVQVVDGRGRVRASSPGGDALVPLLAGAALADVRRGRAREVPGSRIGVDGRLRIVGAPAGTRSDPLTVLVAVSLNEVAGSVRVVVGALLVGAPLLVAGFAAACWLLVGSALRPVAALRRGAADITGTRTARRLPVPVARDEVARLAITLNDMLDRLAVAGTRQRAFVADAAHELRSPLASMRTQLEVAQRHPEVTDLAETTADVLADVARLSRLVDDLLLLARLDDGGRQATDRARGSTVDLRALAAAAVARTRGRVPVRLVSTATDFAAPVEVRADADALDRVLDNLLANAVRHAESGVIVEVSRDGPAARVSVTDDGPGIPPEARARVFERFARVDESRSQDAGGSGLGLSIVREIVRAHSGDVRLEDAAPGLRAVVTLPSRGRPV